MADTPPPWQVALARVEGALPFLPAGLAEGLALRSLRRAWAVHVRDFPFEGLGPQHDAGLEAKELLRSWFAAERHAFLAWLARRAPPPLAAAAALVLAAKAPAGRPPPLTDADRALARLDARLPAAGPVAALVALVAELRGEEAAFLEGGSEVRLAGGRAWIAPAARGAAWAASLAITARPQLFGLGAAPLALAGIAPRELFRPEPERGAATILAGALARAAADLEADLAAAVAALARSHAALGKLYASSHAPRGFALAAALGPLTRAELARALGVTARTASLAATVLADAGLVMLRGDGALVAVETPARRGLPPFPSKPRLSRG